MSEKPVISLEALGFQEHAHGVKYEARYASIGQALGARKLGCRLVVIPPGKRGWPLHFHYVNEEMFIILDGIGDYRHGDEVYPVKAGDVLIARAGEQKGHQLVNTGREELRYFAISTMEQPDVFEYPESGKFGVFVGAAPGRPAAERQFSIIAPKDAEVDYWLGED